MVMLFRFSGVYPFSRAWNCEHISSFSGPYPFILSPVSVSFVLVRLTRNGAGHGRNNKGYESDKTSAPHEHPGESQPRCKRYRLTRKPSTVM